jgi:sporulation protein YlmC with PRC-barrel domain
MKMLEEASHLENLEVFTPWGVSIGTATSVEIESETAEIANIFLEETNEKLVEEGSSILIPYRWVQAVGDIIILRYFPEDLPIRSMEDLGLDEYRY